MDQIFRAQWPTATHLYVCSHRLHVGAFLAEEPNFIRGVVVLILVAESLTFITIFNDLFTERCA